MSFLYFIPKTLQIYNFSGTYPNILLKIFNMLAYLEFFVKYLFVAAHCN